jgi:hypothetical protein
MERHHISMVFLFFKRRNLGEERKHMKKEKETKKVKYLKNNGKKFSSP